MTTKRDVPPSTEAPSSDNTRSRSGVCSGRGSGSSRESGSSSPEGGRSARGSDSSGRRWARLGLAALFTGSGTLHLLRPDFYVPLMPDIMPAQGALILASGAAELVAAAGLTLNARWAAPASVALLLAIFPGNVHFALQATADPTRTRS